MERKLPYRVENEKAEASLYASSLMSGMSLWERIGQLFMPQVRLDNTADAMHYINKLIRDNAIGGILFYKGEAAVQIKLYGEACRLSEVPLFISIDAEWGLAMRLKNTVRFPVNMTLGAVKDIYLIYEYGMMMSRQCRRMGININFAPVLDVNTNPDNPVIGQRSFGENPEKVAVKAIAYAKGLEDGGVLSVGKHFPGHGDTSEDSHKTLPYINSNRDSIINNELYPFGEYIKSGLNGIMTAHLNIPALDDSTGLCSSLSPVIVNGLLKSEMGFEGLVFTDALLMRGAVNYENNALKALVAGNDVMVMPDDIDRQMKVIENAVRDGIIEEDIIDMHCRSVLEYKYFLGLHELSAVTEENLLNDLNNGEAISLSRELFRNSITLMSDVRKQLPLRVEQNICLLSLGEDENLTFVALGGSKIEKRVFEKFNLPVFGNNVSINSDTDYGNVLSGCRDSELLVIEVFSNKSRYIDIVGSLSARPGVVIIFYMNPYKIDCFKDAVNTELNTIVCAFEDSPYAQEFAQKAVFGETGMTGEMPVKLKWL